MFNLGGGSGNGENNLHEFYDDAGGFIIGSAFKVDGLWSNTIDPARVTRIINVLNNLRR